MAKPATRLGSAAVVNENINVAQKVLGEKGYQCFTPAPTYNIKKGFIALLGDPMLQPQMVLLRSRGSFLELRADRVFIKPILDRLRANLWVPIYPRADLLQPPAGTLWQHIHEDHFDELTEYFSETDP